MSRRHAWLWTQRLARWALGAVFVFAGIAKLIGLKFSWSAVGLLLMKGSWAGFKVAGVIAFRDEIRNYRLGSLWWVIHPAAIAMPWIEIVTGLALICGIWVVEAAVMIIAMLVFFNVLIGSAMYRGLDIECGCFGTDMRVGWLKISENLGFIALGILTLVSRWRLARIEGGRSPTRSDAEAHGDPPCEKERAAQAVAKGP